MGNLVESVGNQLVHELDDHFRVKRIWVQPKSNDEAVLCVQLSAKPVNQSVDEVAQDLFYETCPVTVDGTEYYCVIEDVANASTSVTMELEATFSVTEIEPQWSKA